MRLYKPQRLINIAKMIDNGYKLYRIGSIFWYGRGSKWYHLDCLSARTWKALYTCELGKALFDQADDATPLEFLLLTGKDFYKSIRRLR